MSIEAMKQALEALEADEQDMVADKDGHMVFRVDAAITALRQAIEQAEKQEPYLKREVKLLRQEKFELINQRNILQKRIAKLEQAEKQQPLTDEEIQTVHDNVPDNYTDDSWVHAFARAIEAAHGIKGEA